MDTQKFIRRKVFDPVQRVLHWWIGAALMILTALGWMEKVSDIGVFRVALTSVHTVIGFALACGFLARIVWAVIGPRQSRIGALWRAAFGRDDSAQFGYERVAAVAYLILYVNVAVAVLSGLLLAAMRYDSGPFADLLFDELMWHEFVLNLHNAALYGVSIFMLAHITGMILHEKKAELPVAQAMISGYQYRRIKQEQEDV